MFFGLDLGTTNIKAVVLDAGGRVMSVGGSPVERFCSANGGVEQDIDQIWEAVRTAVRAAVGAGGCAGVKAIGVSSQGGAMQLLDQDDRPRGRVISWLDSRGTPYDAALTAELGSDFFIRRIGHGASGVAVGQILRLSSESPDALRSPNRIGFVGDIVVGRLCGRRSHDPTSLSIAMLYNPWLGQSDPDVMARLGLRDEQLPSLLPATTAAGELEANVADAIGLPAGIPVSPAIHDQYAASLGAGSVGVGDVSFGAGTAWVLLANAAALLPPATPEAFVCRHPVEGLCGQMLSMVNGGSSIQWAMSLLGQAQAGMEQVDSLLSAAPPGAEGLRFWPFLAAGPRMNGAASLTGRLSGITLAHESHHVVRAVIEGLACELRRHVEKLVNAGVPIERLIMSGGAASGQGTPKIIADVTRLPVHCVETSDISALGAAMLARSLVEPEAGLVGIARQWTPSRRAVAPSGDAAYEDLYGEYLSILATI